MDFSCIEAKNLTSNIGVFFICDDLKFSQDFYKYAYEADVSKALKVRKNFTAKKGQALSVLPAGQSDFKEIVVLGLGNKKIDISAIQSVGSKLTNYLNGIEAEQATVCINIPQGLKISEEEFIAALYEGMAIRNYKFIDLFVDKKNDNKLYLKKIEFCVHNVQSAGKALKDVQLMIESINFTRDLVSRPGNDLYPETFAQECKKLAKSGLKVKVLDERAMKKLGMGALLGVAMGSAKKPKLVVMEWKGNAKNKKAAPLAFIGKGVTFDSGGISIKPSQNMGDMKYDMAGAGAVTGIMKLLAARKANVNAVGLIGLVENMPSGTAQRPGDVVKSMSGQTIEIDNTDAEGRLVLSDVLWYAQQEYKPQLMIDLATLTGAIVVALGENSYAGLFANEETLAKQLIDAGLKSGDKVWRLPLGDFYDKQISSEIADIRNTGSGRGAGSITAAQFLQRFVKECTWAHLDIAGMAWDKSGSELHPKGATGFGVRLLNQLVLDYYEGK